MRTGKLAFTLATLALLVAGSILPVSGQDDGATRVWKDKTGTFRLEATLESVSAGKVRLRRNDDGRTIEVALASLADADIEFIKSRAPEIFTEPEKKPLTAAALEAAAKRRRYA